MQSVQYPAAGSQAPGIFPVLLNKNTPSPKGAGVIHPMEVRVVKSQVCTVHGNCSVMNAYTRV